MTTDRFSVDQLISQAASMKQGGRSREASRLVNQALKLAGPTNRRAVRDAYRQARCQREAELVPMGA